jgi:D-xylose transport system substrate-binding protein
MRWRSLVLDTRKLATSLIAVAAIVVGCSSSATPTPAPVVTAPPVVATPTPAAPVVTPTAAAPAGVTADSFLNPDNSAMKLLTDVVSGGSGKIGIILPDATTSGRYVAYDQPYLTAAFKAAGYADADIKIDNAQGQDATEISLADADIALGVKVLIVDPLDGPTGKAIQAKAAAAGIPMISYDRATFQGDKTYYVSFNNVNVGKLIGQGVQQCVKDWAVTSPKVYVLHGGQDTDPNAIDFAKGYNQVIWGQAVANVAAGATNADGWTLVKEEVAPGWDNAKGGTIFTQAFTAHPEINVTVEANDGLAGAVIQDLKKAGISAKKIPTAGQDATLTGMEFVLQDWQCGSVYKPIYIEAQAAVALASFLRAGQTPPAALLNGTTTDPTNASVTEPAVLLTPVWVNKANMEATVIKDKFIDVTKLCAAVGADVCSAAGIS